MKLHQSAPFLRVAPIRSQNDGVLLERELCECYREAIESSYQLPQHFGRVYYVLLCFAGARCSSSVSCFRILLGC